jgi:hypothetical protein
MACQWLFDISHLLRIQINNICTMIPREYILEQRYLFIHFLQYKISMITISETMKTMQHHRLFDIGHHFESFTVATTTWLTVME